MNTVAISVIIPTLNRGHLLSYTLDSLRQQTFEDWEAIVVDDGSSDHTEEVMHSYTQQDARIRYWQPHRSPQGAPVCRNLGTQQARGRYVIFMDSDDLLAPSALAQRFAVLEENPHLDFAVFPCVLFRQHPQDLKLMMHRPIAREIASSHADPIDLDRFLACHLPWQTLSPIWRRSTLDRVGPWDESLLSWQDVEFHVRALSQDLAYRYVETPDYFWRIQQTQSVTATSERPEHLINHLTFLQRVHQQLSAHNLLTTERRAYLVRIFFWLMDRWARVGRAAEAYHVWEIAQELGLFRSPQPYRHGLRYIQVNCLPLGSRWGLGKVIHRLSWELWRWRHPELVLSWSSEFMKTPLDRAVDWPTLDLARSDALPQSPSPH